MTTPRSFYPFVQENIEYAIEKSKLGFQEVEVLILDEPVYNRGLVITHDLLKTTVTMLKQHKVPFRVQWNSDTIGTLTLINHEGVA